MSPHRLKSSILILSLAPTLALADDFLSEGQAQLEYRQYYFNADPDSGMGPTRDEWVQGMLVDYQSGFYRDIIGFDLGYGVADALHISNGADSITNLSAGDDVQHPHSISTPTSAYLKLRLGDEDNRLRLGWGKKSRDYQLYTDNTTRILPASSIGYDITYDYQDLSLYAARIDRFSPRDESGWGDDLETFDGRSINRVDLAGLSVELPGEVTFETEYLTARDYLDESFFRLSHDVALPLDSTLSTSLAHGAQHDGGDLFETQGVPRRYQADDSHDARYDEASLTWRLPGKYLGLAYTQVDGDNYDRTLFAEDHGSWNSEAKNFYWFGLEGEQMWKVSAGMDLSPLGLEGLRWDGHYAFSDAADGYQDFSRREFLSLLRYRFSGPLDGLSLAWLHIDFETLGEPAPGSGKALTYAASGFITHDTDRLYLTYRYTF
ncbi:OprD family outer membrane porin [Halomonas sp. SL1]|uniref:OprD family outer membrane porin n=1 Tax=Halomonas sp. SL1 TaxID=2137478 RepID=UPI000D15B534|nr:OprD family outer membrane porin [Halomonas sp. SL1]RAH37697.1 outer membrane porin, OprD family [Halomonas sp. SL1]